MTECGLNIEKVLDSRAREEFLDEDVAWCDECDQKM